MAIVAEGDRERIYISPPLSDSNFIKVPETSWLEQPLPDNPRWFSPPGYGLPMYSDLFTPRQLVALTTFSDKVLEADGSTMRVRTALALINQTLDEVLAEQEGEFDTDTRWAVAWFDQHGFEEGLFGVAETLSKAKNTSVPGMVEAGILTAKAGKVRLLRRDELNPHWDPTSDGRLTAWETTQHLIRVLETEGEAGAAQLLANLGGRGELARDLAYRLYTTCERKKWAQDALAFNSLVVSWPEIVRLAAQKPEQRQEEVF